MKLNISHKQLQKTILAPTMQQSIEVLLLPIADLGTYIDQQLQENPLLEIDEEKSRQNEQNVEQWLAQRQRDLEYSKRLSSHDFLNDENYEERPITRHTALADHLLQQLRLETSEKNDLYIGEFIIGNLNDEGFCVTPVNVMAEILGIKDVKKVQKILELIQSFDPIGIASSNLKQCLLTQAEYRFNGSGALIKNIIENYFEDLAKRHYSEIARKLKTSIEKIRDSAKLISQLEPKPARKFTPIDNSIYIKPDITIIKNEQDEFEVVVNSDRVPQLRINTHYQKLLKEPNRTKEEKEFLTEKIKNAITFMKSIEQRGQTITQIAQYILDYQKDFFTYGSEHLKPMILKDIAQAIERNESTVSRAINNKYMDTPQGLISFKYFFSQAASPKGESSLSSQSVKEEIKNLVQSEPTYKPLTDQEIYHYLSKKGMSVARRTVSKYRQALKILPSHLRKV